MKKIIIAFIVMFCALPVHAAQIALADADYLMNEAAAAKDIKKQLKTQRDKFQQEFKTTEAILQKEERAILEQRKNLTEAEFKKQVETFQKKMVDEQKKFEQRKAKLDDGFAKALKELQMEIGKVIQEVAKEQGHEIVISKQSALFAAAGQADITSEVLKRLDTRKQSIKVDY